MLFDRPAALPVATMRSRSRVATIASWVRGFRSASWRWFKPRLVPVAVALTGMFAVLGSAEYLTRLARRTPEQVTPSASEQLATLKLDTDPAAAIDTLDDSDRGELTLENGPVGATIVLDRNPAPIGRVIQLPSAGARMQIRLVPSER